MSKKNSVFKEFKAFVLRGNVVDMAIGIIIGSAFTAIVSSFVADIFNPLLGFIIGDIDFAELRIILVAADEAAGVAEVAIRYGVLIEKIISFLLTALVLFAIIKTINKTKEAKESEKKAEAEAKAKADAEAKAAADAAAAKAAADAKEAEENEKKMQLQLLTEIRDLLKK